MRWVLREINVNKFLYALLLPGILFFFIFNYLPLVGLYYAFVDFNPMAGLYGFKSEFVGWYNLKFFFTSDDWIHITFNTVFLNALFIVTGLTVQMLMAIGLNELRVRFLSRTFQSLMFLPNFISWTVVAVFASAIFATDGGLLNQMLNAMGLQTFNFYQDPDVWPALLVFLRLWKGVGFGTVIYLATIAGIDQEIYEAAKIDGASRTQSILRITVPLLRPTTVMLFILSIGGIVVGDFGMIYALVGDNPLLRPTTDIIDTYVYRALRVDGNIGMSAAVSLFQSVVGFIMVLSANGLVKKMDKDSALF
ncbi:ABC transporter permease [Cohnella fermenti]|uniref:Sugar ABC transporter permease n=1 Tax=Cohnella fermenti TaxID=2565925 RepID=A0A4V3WE01_9BACL|nr:ABC transporter permease subunit [Cohnella fermenti]THF74295.1 sugar ABC transporter permease [Cohnella fermenti]